VRYAAIASFQNLNTIGIILLTSPLWFRYIERPESILNVILLVLLIPISASIMYFLDTIIGLMAFFITEINGLTLNYRFISSTLSGRLFPLGLLIPLFWINAANPFGYLFYHPMQLYFGNYNAAEVAGIFIVGILWAVALYGTTQALFKFGLRRNESVGL
jgi:ABC-2 type transport system permease protein